MFHPHLERLRLQGVVYPLLMTGYIGQTACLSKHLDEVEHAFFKSVPGYRWQPWCSACLTVINLWT
ncbi:hypothetical protein M758_UG058500 [Ceratodon purpureus]|nr:hypothetical protein M758_UG017800 [Ceratodon purpureus]KAG0594214.1 hypothetical protein M758_UG058500 [Ceratodon purpureus]